MIVVLQYIYAFVLFGGLIWLCTRGLRYLIQFVVHMTRAAGRVRRDGDYR